MPFFYENVSEAQLAGVQLTPRRGLFTLLSVDQRITEVMFGYCGTWLLRVGEMLTLIVTPPLSTTLRVGKGGGGGGGTHHLNVKLTRMGLPTPRPPPPAPPLKLLLLSTSISAS